MSLMNPQCRRMSIGREVQATRQVKHGESSATPNPTFPLPAMIYSIIQPPFSLASRPTSVDEPIEYAKWYREIMPDRLHGLTIAVQSTPGYEHWTPDYTPASLDVLGAWFAEVVETHPRSREELQAVKDWFVMPIETQDWELTDRSFSIALDVSMYLCHLFMKNHPSINWYSLISGVNGLHFRPVILTGFGPLLFNPVNQAITLASGLARGSRDRSSLRDMYERWAPLVAL